MGSKEINYAQSFFFGFRLPARNSPNANNKIPRPLDFPSILIGEPLTTCFAFGYENLIVFGERNDCESIHLGDF
jgi:hypothetical protein